LCRARAEAVAASADSKAVDVFPRGQNWEVHKFGGTCMATPERIEDMVEMIGSSLTGDERKFGAFLAIYRHRFIFYR